MRASNWPPCGRCSGWLAMLIAAIAPIAGAAAPPASRLPWHISGSGRLVDAVGSPVIVNGEAAWSLAVSLKPNEVREYLDDRRARGFNAILVEAVEWYFSKGGRNALGDLPFKGAAFHEPQEAYFHNLDQLIEAAGQRGIVVFLLPAYLGYECGEEGWCSQVARLSIAEARAYGEFLGHRYRDRTNIVWVHGGDADARRYGVLPQVTAMAEGIRDAAPAQLHTAECGRYTLGSDCYPWPWMQIDSVYGDCDSVVGLTSRAHATSHRPYLMIEGRYEDAGADAKCLRGQFLTSVLGGGVGQMFGTYYVRVFLPQWRDHLSSPGSRDLTWLNALVPSLDPFDLEPLSATPSRERLVLLSGFSPPTSRNAAVVAAAPDGHRLLAYLPSSRPLLLRSAGRHWCASWIDLATRQRHAASLESVSNQWVRARPQGAQDSLLIANTAPASAGCPGQPPPEP